MSKNVDESTTRNGAPLLGSAATSSTSPIRLGGLRNAGRVLNRLQLQVTRVAQPGAGNQSPDQKGFWRVSLPKNATMSSTDRASAGGGNSNEVEEEIPRDGPIASLQQEMMSYHEVVLKKLVANGNIRLACQFAGCYEACQRLVVNLILKHRNVSRQLLNHIIHTWKLRTERGHGLDISNYAPTHGSGAGADRFLKLPPNMPCEFVASPDHMVRSLALLLSDLGLSSEALGNTSFSKDSVAGPISACDDSAAPASAGAATTSSPASRLAVLGMDVEWRPIFDQESTGKRPQAAILQLATRDRILVLDLRELLFLQTFKEIHAGAFPQSEKTSAASDMLLQQGVSLLRDLFRNPTVFKVGTDFQHDLDILRDSFAGVDCFDELQRYIDMTTLDALYHEVLVGRPSKGGVSTSQPAKAPDAPAKASVESEQSMANSEKTVHPSDSKHPAPRTMEHDRSCYKEKSFQGEPYLKKISKRIRRQQKKKKRKSNFSSGGSKAAPRARGLSAIVREILGKPLDKHEQVSDWERRPLTKSQMNYAALDAVCQVMAFDRVVEAAGMATDVSRLTTKTLVAATPSSPAMTSLLAPSKPCQMTAKDQSQSGSLRVGLPLAPSESPHGPEHVKACLVSHEKAVGRALPVYRVGPTGLGRHSRVSVTITSNERGCATESEPSTMCLLKNICIVGPKDKLFVIVARCSDRIDFRLLSHIVKEPRKKLRLATADECVKVFGYRPGAVPPVAHLADQVHVVIDAMAAAAAETFPQGGTGGGCGFPVQLSPYQSGIISEPAPETSSFHSKARSSDNEFRFVCGAGHPQLVFLATLQELEILTGAICIANVTDMKDFFRSERQRVAVSGGVGVGAANTEAVPHTSIVGGTSPRPRFLADSMMSRLGRWMRALGIDVEIWEGERNFFEIALAALQDQRILITRDHGLATWKDTQAVFVIPTNDTKEALKAVLDHFGLTFDESSFLTRCGKCNGSHLDFIAKEKLANDPRVPPKVFKRIDHFWECGTCHHVYWEGPKFFEAREMFESLCDAQGALRKSEDKNDSNNAAPGMVPAPLIMEAIAELRHEQQAGLESEKKP
eukprot:INCI6771.1.p1 GENE.INCI6771.1~~INCI6771.1.p1  ORF type:complete len:1078 (-),score=170.54 INCI6771.1:118-3351(-)